MPVLPQLVMTGLVPVIHALRRRWKDVDRRDKPLAGTLFRLAAGEARLRREPGDDGLRSARRHGLF
jgi:hypothetical protein